MAGGLGVLFGKDPLNLSLEDQISFAAQVMIMIIVKSENDDFLLQIWLFSFIFNQIPSG